MLVSKLCMENGCIVKKFELIYHAPSKATTNGKVIIHKSRGKVSLAEQVITDYASTAYFEAKKKKYIYNFFIAKILCNFLVQTLKCFQKNLKKQFCL